MKKYIGIITTLLLLVGCNDGFLDKDPVNTQNEATAFKTYDNFKTFGWLFYNNFVVDYNKPTEGDMHAGYMSTNATSEPNTYRSGNIVAGATNDKWTFKVIRRANLVLKHIDDSQMTQKQKDHWRSFAYFWRAYAYTGLIQDYGDVPWVETVVTETDIDIIYGERQPRKTVADKILADLQYAEININVNGDGKNTINRDVVRALMSRFTLFEGTWRKYHKLGDHETYLNECIRVSSKLVDSYPNIMSAIDGRYTTELLTGQPGIIISKEYIAGINGHYRSRYVRTSSNKYEYPKYTIDAFLCSDGKTIDNSSEYDGDKNIYDQFRNRDLRLLFHAVPPYSTKASLKGGQNPPSFAPAAKPIYNTSGYYVKQGTDNDEYIKLMKTLTPETGKRLPAFNWSGSTTYNSPNILGPCQAPMASRSGYTAWKEYNIWENNLPNQNSSDRAIYFIEEPMLNLAEAHFEMGSFSQGIADITINKLRVRAGVEPMTTSTIDDNFDPRRDKATSGVIDDYEVHPLLWEIRRERMVELLDEGFGWNDIRRWKKGPWYINKPQIGVYIDRDDYFEIDKNGQTVATPDDDWNSVLLVNDENFVTATGKEGYVKRFDNPTKLGKGWNDKYYLTYIPTNQIILNPNIKQNPGW